MDHDLMLAVLAMDAYTPHSAIGLATNLNITLPSGSGSSGFSAVAYSYNGETVISYRGTDGYYISDAYFGWGAGVGAETTQAGQAAEFYKSVLAATIGNGSFPYSTDGTYSANSTNIVFTGHSLGGGLAGLLASLYHKQAVIFDNMAYQNAAQIIYDNATTPVQYVNGIAIPNDDYQRALDLFYGTANPLAPNISHITGYQEAGQILEFQSTGTVVGAGVNWGLHVPISAQISLHSMALLVLNMYAEQQVVNNDWKAVAFAFGPLLLALNGGTNIAYSVVQEGIEPSGDAAAQLMFNDMNDLAPIFDATKSTNIALWNSSEMLNNLAGIILNYDQYLATNQKHLADVGTEGLAVSVAGEFSAFTLDKSGAALTGVADTSGIDAIKA
jgi:Lipase (class 3)